jgi:hypothetical protein
MSHNPLGLHGLLQGQLYFLPLAFTIHAFHDSFAVDRRLPVRSRTVASEEKAWSVMQVSWLIASHSGRC